MALENTEKQNAEQLQVKLRKLKEEQENLEYDAKQILREEEDEDMEISHSHTVLAQMREKCSSEDSTIQRLIDEKQDALSTFRRKKIEFDEEFHQEMTRQRQTMEKDMEELRMQIKNVKYTEREEVINKGEERVHE